VLSTIAFGPNTPGNVRRVFGHSCQQLGFLFAEADHALRQEIFAPADSSCRIRKKNKPPGIHAMNCRGANSFPA